MTRKPFAYEIILGILILCVVLGAFFLHGVFERTVAHVNFFKSKDPVVSVGMFVGLSVLAVIFGPFTGFLLVPPAVKAWGTFNTFLLLELSWVLGGVIVYALGRFVGYPIVTRIISREKADEFAHFITRRATFFIAFLFRLMLPAEAGYVFGLVRYSFWRYFVIMSIVEAMLAYTGVYLSDAITRQHYTLFFWSLALGLVLAGLFVYFYKHKFMAMASREERSVRSS